MGHAKSSFFYYYYISILNFIFINIYCLYLEVGIESYYINGINCEIKHDIKYSKNIKKGLFFKNKNKN